MTWYAIIDSANNLISVGEVIADANTLSSKGYTAITLSNNPVGQSWDSNTRSFITVATKNSYPKLDFVQRFTATEFMSIKGSTDPEVQFFLYQIEQATMVTPQDATVQNGLNYLVSVGLLTTNRAAIIGAN